MPLSGPAAVSVLADHLNASIRQRGSAGLTAVTLRLVEQAAILAVAVPATERAVGLWFRLPRRRPGMGGTTRRP